MKGFSVLLVLARTVLLAGFCDAALAGNVKSGLVLYVADDNTVTFLHNGSSAFPGFVGHVASPPLLDLPYLGGWGCHSGAIDWQDSNTNPVLHMDCNGLDIFIHEGHANSNGSKVGNVTLTATTEVGLRLRNEPGLGGNAFQELVFKNGGAEFMVAGCVTIGHPDLTLDKPSVTDATPDAGDSIDITATARNVGDGTCESTVMRFYRSLDPTISASDELLTSRSVGALASAATETEVVSVSVPTNGRYWFGACLEAITGETIRGEPNCSQGVKVLVGPPCDLVSIENESIGTMETREACKTLTVGPMVLLQAGAAPPQEQFQGVSLFGGESVQLFDGVTISSDAQVVIGTCDRDICSSDTPGTPSPDCMPCVQAIHDSLAGTGFNFCAIFWGAGCVSGVATVCQMTCP